MNWHAYARGHQLQLRRGLVRRHVYTITATWDTGAEKWTLPVSALIKIADKPPVNLQGAPTTTGCGRRALALGNYARKTFIF